jgi:iron complex outermembrane receptor protein
MPPMLRVADDPSAIPGTVCPDHPKMGIGWPNPWFSLLRPKHADNEMSADSDFAFGRIHATRRMSTRRRLLAGALLVSIGTLTDATARAEAVDLTDLSIEELLDLKVEVTSAAKKPQALGDVAAAVFVLTADDIRRSGATSIPEALKFVPGLDVAQVDRNSWAISARGFNSTFASKLLVLIDGRSVYNPLFSGVFWSLEQTLIEDIDRIEVIRGPGATLWGANAVNGVINIITKDARSTEGTLLVGGGGTEKTGFGAVRQGARFGEDGAVRLYAQYDRGTPGKSETGDKAADSLSGGQAGFRADWRGSADDAFTLLGGANVQRVGESALSPSYSPPFMTVVDNKNDDVEVHALGRWTHTFSSASNFSLQTYYNHEEYNWLDMRTWVNTADIDFQHRFSPAAAHDLVWGVGYRYTNVQLTGTTFAFVPATSTQNLASTFFQDDWTVSPQTFHLIAGAKLEHNNFTGIEVQPSARALWTPDTQQTVWAAVSRAVRTPSAGEEYAHGVLDVVPGAPPIGIQDNGSYEMKSEKVIALESGYRIQPYSRFIIDTTLFYNFDDDLVSSQQQPIIFVPSPPQHLLVPLLTNNGMAGDSFGSEVALDWKPIDGWRLRGSYSYLRMHLHMTGQLQPIGETIANGILQTAEQSPRHQVILQSFANLGHDLELDISAKYMSALPAFSIGQRSTVDVRLGWTGIKGLELSLVGQNLFFGSHLQFRPDLLPWVPTKVGPSVYAKAVVQF